MESAAAGSSSAPIVDRKAIGTVLFMALFLFSWISLTPFYDLTGEAVLDPSAGNSNRLNQIVFLLLFGCMLVYGVMHPMRRMILQPRILLATIFLWFLFVSVMSAHSSNSIKSVILAVMMIVNASIYLMLPASEKHFAKMLAIGSLAALGLSYYGIFMLPQFSIHQAAELREPMNVGLWRGHFPHKNSAAAAMVLMSFFGLFVMRAWSRIIGAVIFALAAFFLMQTGGKTSTAMLPLILVLAFIVERFPVLRIPVVVGGVAAFNLFAVGSSVYRPFGEFVASLGIDATFTNRADVWRFAFAAIAEHPFTGYGFRSFWQTEELLYSGGQVETWAVAAANGHNSFVDILLATGIPGLVLTIFWIIFMPLRDISRIDAKQASPNLTRFFLRVWLYGLFHAGLESLFYEGGNVLWFTFVVGLYGFRFQSTATLVGREAAGRATAT
ncbi:O-antigen ligase family protein [Oryzicola mucosus]|uniref:O-antigen ligase family protein n=1 Tax=Oryzicola mucosus TaxID=2767425 RepID=A0A8J6PIS8_9HYPH|nr:O-antigen ligase [Oryzicola mucosus]MBD0414933.1 O-antigen ligase family protein [Oryzicola mucosus]